MSIKSMLEAKAEREKLKQSFDITITPILTDKGPRYRVDLTKDDLVINKDGISIQANPGNGRIAARMDWETENRLEAKMTAKRAIDLYIRNAQHLGRGPTTMKVER